MFAEVNLTVYSWEWKSARKGKSIFLKIFCNKVLWAQYNVLLTDKITYNDLNHIVMPYSPMQSSDLFWNTTWYLKNSGKITLLVWKRRKKEEFLGPFACEADQDKMLKC